MNPMGLKLRYCTDCKYSPQISERLFDYLCGMYKFDYTEKDFVTGLIHLDEKNSAEYKNKTGLCSDYIPSDFNERIDFIIEKNRLELAKNINQRFNHMKTFNRSCTSIMARLFSNPDVDLIYDQLAAGINIERSN